MQVGVNSTWAHHTAGALAGKLKLKWVQAGWLAGRGLEVVSTEDTLAGQLKLRWVQARES